MHFSGNSLYFSKEVVYFSEIKFITNLGNFMLENQILKKCDIIFINFNNF
jgi:hypothetical protein